MLKEQQSSSSSFFLLPNPNPLLLSFNIPEPIIHPPGIDPDSFLKPKMHKDDKLKPVTPLVCDPCAISRTEFFVNTTDLTASEHAGGSLTEASMAPMASDSPVNSETSAPQIVNDPLMAPMAPDFPANSETSTPMIMNDVVETKMASKTPKIIHCDVCNVTCNSEVMLKEHKVGKNHLKKMKKLSLSSPIMQEMSPEVAKAILDQESKKKKEDSIQVEASVESLFVCNIPELKRITEHPQGEKHEAQETSGPLVKSSNSGTKKEQDELIVGQMLRCEVCRVTCNSKQNFQRHILGKNHLKKIKFSEQMRPPPLTTPTSTATTPVTALMEKIGDSEEVKPGWCEVCKIISTRDFSEHVIGKRHMKNLKKSEKTPVLPSTPIEPVEIPKSTKGGVVKPKEAHRCELCGIRCNSSGELNEHILGKIHKKNVHKTQKLNRHVVAPDTEKMLQHMWDEGGKVLILEMGKRKANGSLASEEVNAKRKKVVTEGRESGGRTISCKMCNVACTNIKAFTGHLARQEHSAMALKQVNVGLKET